MFRIQHLQWLAILATAIGCALLGGSAVLTSLDGYRSFVDSTEQLEQFSVILDASTAISAERGPANSAMAATEQDRAVLRHELEEKRSQTDAAIARVETLLVSRRAEADTLQAIEEVRSQLRNGREKVDLAASPLKAERDPLSIERAILAMFAASDSATALRELVGGKIMSRHQGLAGEILLANSAATMREHQGRLGSYVVMALVAPPERDPQFLQLMQATEGIVRNLWTSTVSMADNLLLDQEITDLVEAVRRDYFEGVLIMALRDAEEHTATNSLSVADFTANYVAGMRSSEHLRAAVVDHAIASFHRGADNTMAAVLRAGLLTVATLAVLVIVAVVFRRALFAPLMRMHEHVVSLAGGNHAPPAPIEGMAREVADIFKGLQVLRENLTQKRLLEEEQRRLNRQLRYLAETDTLTGLLNRRALMNRINAVFRRADSNGESLAVVLFDIDHFKTVNDTHGHTVGDEVLQAVSRIVERSLRTGDTLARIGGEEFVIILRDVGGKAAQDLLENLRSTLAATPVQDELNLRVSASFGVAIRPSGLEISWDELYSLADQRLYMAKSEGRDRVVMEGFSPHGRRRA